MESAPAGKATPSGGKGSTETEHITVKDNQLKTKSTSDGSLMSEARRAY